MKTSNRVQKAVALTFALACAGLAVLVPQAKFLMAGEGYYVGYIGYIGYVGYVDYVERISVAYDGVGGDDRSEKPGISADGLLVAFESLASNLLPEGSGDGRQIYLRDRENANTWLVSQGPDGNPGDADSANPALSDDGSQIAFESNATNLIDAVDGNGVVDIFVHDRIAQTSVRASIGSAGDEADGPSAEPDLSADGRTVAFSSLASNLVDNDGNDAADVFVHEIDSGLTERVSVDSSGGEADAGSGAPTISADGRRVVFESDADNLVPGDSNGARDIFLHDRDSASTRCLSLTATGSLANGDSFDATISSDGTTVAFASDADNLVAGDSNASSDIFVLDLASNAITRISVDSDGNQADADSRRPALSADGRYISFDSLASNLTLVDTLDAAQVYVHDRLTHTTLLASRSIVGTPGGDDSLASALSADGNDVVFQSNAPLLPTDDNQAADIYAFDLTALEEQARIRGRVVDEQGRPLTGILGSAYPWASNSHGYAEMHAADSALTNAGSFELAVLLSSAYSVCFEDPNGIYASICWRHANVPWYADAVVGKRGYVTSGIDAVMALAGTLTGNVTDDAGTGLAGIQVSIGDWVYDGDGQGWLDAFAWTETGQDGSYRLADLQPGTYSVCFQDWTENADYVAECFDDIPYGEIPARVDIEPGETVTGIDASLATGGRIQGRVSSTDGAALAGIDVSVGIHVIDRYGNRSPKFVASSITDEEGHYSIGALPADTYWICFDDLHQSRYQSRCFDNAPDIDTATLVQISLDTTFNAIDAVLPRPLGVLGRITDTAGSGLPWIEVGLRPIANPDDEYLLAYTDSDGYYAFDWLPNRWSAGEYRLCSRSHDQAFASTCRDISLAEGDNMLDPLALATAIADAYEPDDQWQNASAITSGETQQRSIAQGNSDWVSFSLAERSAVVIETVLDKELRLVAFFYEVVTDPDQYGDWLSYLEFYGSNPLRFERLACAANALDPGDYRLHIMTDFLSTWGNGYTLSLTTWPCSAALDSDADGSTNDIDNCLLTANPDQADTDQDGLGDACDPHTIAPDVYEPDNSFDDAGPIADNETQARNLSPEDDRDYLGFDLIEEAAVRATIVPTDDFNGQLYLDLFAWVEDGNSNDWFFVDSAFADQYRDYPAIPGVLFLTCGDNELAAGAYRMLVYRFIYSDYYNNRMGSRAYDISLELFPCRDDADGDHDGIAHAVDNCPYDSNPDQADTNCNGIGDACDSADHYEPDNTLAEARPIVPGETQQHSIKSYDDVDWVVFTVEADSAVTMDIASDDQYLSIELFDAAGEPTGDRGYQWSQYRHLIERSCIEDPLPAGLYYAQVRPFFGLVMDYRLSLGVTACPSPPDTDLDDDGIDDPQDNCRTTANADQADRDQDGAGDACDLDNDNDGVADDRDNCPRIANASQVDADLNGNGDACDPATVIDFADYFPLQEGRTWHYTRAIAGGSHPGELARILLKTEVDFHTVRAWQADYYQQSSESTGRLDHSDFYSLDADALNIHGYRTYPGGEDPAGDIVYDQPLQIRRQMAIGDSFSSQGVGTDANGDPIAVHMTTTLEGMEDVMVPAGLFQGAARLLTQYSDGNRDISWFAPGIGKLRRASMQSGDETWWIEELVKSNLETPESETPDPDTPDLNSQGNDVPDGIDKRPVNTNPGQSALTDAGVADARDDPGVIAMQSINTAPRIASIDNQQIDEGVELVVDISCTDLEGNGVNIDAADLPTGATMIDNGDCSGQFLWTPDLLGAGTYPDVLIRAIDDGEPPAQGTETFTITVGGGNRPPVFDEGIAADLTAVVGEPIAFPLSATDPDEVAGDLVFGTVNNTPLPYGATLSNHLPGNAEFSWTPTFDQIDEWKIVFTVMDNGTPRLTDEHELTIVVGDLPRTPILNPIGDHTIDELEPFALSIIALGPDGQIPALTLEWISSEAMAPMLLAGSLPLGADFTDYGDGTGQLDWIASGEQARLGYLFEACAVHNLDPGLVDCEQFTIRVGNINRPPEIDPIGDKTATEGELLEFIISANDPDPDRIRFSSANLPLGAWLQDNDNRSATFSWTPISGDAHASPYTITFVATDDFAEDPLSDQQNIRITVMPDDVRSAP